MIKVVFYTDTPIYGGAERHMTLLASHLNPEKYQVTFVFSDYKQLKTWQEQLKTLKIPFHAVKVAHKHDPRHFTALKKILNDLKPEILHLHLWNPGSCRYAFYATDRKVTKIIATEHDPFPLRGIKRSLKKQCLKKTAHTIAVSNANHDLLLKEYPELKNRISVIHNGIDLSEFEKALLRFSAQEKQKIRTVQFKSEADDFIIECIAALHPRKGLKYLIEAFKKVAETIPKAKLVILGEGPQENELKKLIKNLDLDNKIVLLGFQKNIPKLLKSSDLFILPSIKEAFGLVLLEAMACQLPVIASNVGGIPEIINDHKNGELVPPANIQVLADKIIEIYKNKAQREKIAFLGNHDVKKFDAKEMAQKTENVYNKILNHESPKHET